MEKLTFAELEKTIHEYQMEESRRIMKEVLEEADEYIKEHRDEQLYLTVDRCSRSINTVFGTVTFTRQGYKVGSRSGDAEHINGGCKNHNTFLETAARHFRGISSRLALRYSTVALPRFPLRSEMPVFLIKPPRIVGRVNSRQ